MTEDQKIEALQRILQGANVAQVNLGDGYQTFNLSRDGKWQQEPVANEDVVNGEVDNDDANQSVAAEKPRGPRKKFLFALDGMDTKEDETVKVREKDRLCTYLSQHCLKSRKLVCTKDDTLNKTIVCFLLKWMEKGLTAEEPSGGAVFRFLTEDCGILSEVQERAYGNRVKEWIKDKNGYDAEVMLMVKEAFK